MPRVIERVVEYRSQEPCKTADEMENICCEPTGELVCCEAETGGTWGGYSEVELMDKYHPGLSTYEKNFIRIELRPRQRPCGYFVTEYDVADGRCCDGVAELEYDWDESADVISGGGTGYVYVTGGKAPFRWTIQGDGFRFLDAGTTITTDSRVVEVEATEGSCGTAEITVTDFCRGGADGRVRSGSSGQWVEIYNTQQETNNPSDWCVKDGRKIIDDWCADDCDLYCTGNEGAAICPQPDGSTLCWVEGRIIWEWQC